MEEIQDLVRQVVRQCASRGVKVSEVLAAFVARTVSQSRSLEALIKKHSVTQSEEVSKYLDMIVILPFRS